MAGRKRSSRRRSPAKGVRRLERDIKSLTRAVTRPVRRLVK